MRSKVSNADRETSNQEGLRNGKHILSLCAIVSVLATVVACQQSGLLTNIQERISSYQNGSQTVSMPTFSPSAGTYSSDQSVTISDSTAGATIYYTTNGTTPTTSSSTYTGGSIAITGPGTTETVEAIAAKSGMANSAVASETYKVLYQYTLAVGAANVGGGQREEPRQAAER
jgi:hypothetical protein